MDHVVHLPCLAPSVFLQRFFQNKTTDASRLPNLGNWCRGPGQQQPIAIHWTIHCLAHGQNRHRAPPQVFAQARVRAMCESPALLAPMNSRGHLGRRTVRTVFATYIPAHLSHGWCYGASKETNRIVDQSRPDSTYNGRLGRVGAGRATPRLAGLAAHAHWHLAPPAYLGNRPLDERRPFRKKKHPGSKLVGQPDELDDLCLVPFADRQEPVGQIIAVPMRCSAQE
ncbi:hypothetical protein EDB83DRAFT_1625694 [Lactarius deliciosus]|nr:hypothetical protein EDB83DRAFT_1625694 [Lactarius deliciosus]